MKRYILLFLLITSCSYPSQKNSLITNNLDFSQNLTIEEFKSLLDQYVKESPYPDINE